MENSKQIKVSCWNVNSIRARMPVFEEYIKENSPDILLLQEIKCEDHNFPADAIEYLGYNIVLNGQKTFNGVAILSKSHIEVNTKNFDGNPDETQARYIEGFSSGITFASAYIPNGQEIGSDKFSYKLAFLENLKNYLASKVDNDEAFIIAGDFNVAPFAIDIFDPKNLDGTVCFHASERKLLREIINLGFIDLYRIFNPTKQEFTWWDYRSKGYEKHQGYRIDFILGNAKAADICASFNIAEHIRGKEKTSDHAPIEAVFSVL